MPALFTSYIPPIAEKSQRRRGGWGGNVSVFPDWRDNAEEQPKGLSFEGVINA